jgi:hypothetical protein
LNSSDNRQTGAGGNNSSADNASAVSSEEFDAWNPGLSSQIPADLESQITLFRPENSSVSLQRATELADFCGLNKAELVWFRVERLVVHELLVRVTSDLSVPDGPNYEDLGISLRSMVSAIFHNHAQPQLPSICTTVDARVETAEAWIREQLDQHLFPAAVVAELKSAGSLLSRLFGARQQVKPKPVHDEPIELVALRRWRDQLNTISPSDERHCLEALVKVIDSLVAHRGRVLKEPQLITDIALSFAANSIGEEVVSEALEKIFPQAVAKENYRLLPTQSHPVVMNVKGASASGKSTIRPQQRQLAGKLGIPWEDFALVSPDYWRKYLLDYQSLGEHAKYAAMLTGQELEIIDKKLDRYMARKAKKNQMSHLLIDRFRFDSFSVDAGKSQDSKLLSRFGDRIYLFFMVTPPAETVVRAWERGKTTGRFKAVDDLLYHNIEAYTGIPELFLSWVLSADKQVHFEFLDNDVPKGELPRTAAFGCNQSMTVVDPLLLRNIDRYRSVNIDAGKPEEVLVKHTNSEAEFLRRCVVRIAEVQFLDPRSGAIYAVFRNGQLVWSRLSSLTHAAQCSFVEEFLADFTQSAPSARSKNALDTPPAIDIELLRHDTLGQWGDAN